MKRLRWVCTLLLIFLYSFLPPNILAQGEIIGNANITNTQADFSCPGQVTVTYDLTTSQPVDVTLYYSHNQCDWLVAQTVSGDLFNQTTGTGKTIIWYNYTDNVRFGKFYFKVEAPQPPCDGIMLNGVCWAERNVNMPGTFAASPEDLGMLYQWGSNVGWSSTNPLTGSDGSIVWMNFQSYLDIWPSEKNPCPAGWRVPKHEEIQGLSVVSNYWDNLNGVNGRFFGTTEPRLFLPAAGGRYCSGGNLHSVGTGGNYWAYEGGAYTTYRLSFNNSNVDPNTLSNGCNAYSVRCVKE